MSQLYNHLPALWAAELRVSADEIKAHGYNLDIKNPDTVDEELDDPEALLERLNSAEAEVVAVRDQLKGILAEALLR